MNTAREQFDIKTVYEWLTGYEVKIPAHTNKRATKVLCPAHNEKHPSCELDLDKQVWYCHSQCRRGGDAVEMVIASGILGLVSGKGAYHAAFEWLRALSGTRNDLKAQPGLQNRTTRKLAKIQREIVYPFTGRDGKIAYDEVRYEGVNFEGEQDKDVLLRRPLPAGAWFLQGDKYVFRDPMGRPVPYGPLDPSPIERDRYHRNGTARRKPRADYLYTIHGMERLLYRLPEVKAYAQQRGRLHIVEGAKKNDILRARTGWTVTTMAKGTNAQLEDAWLDDVTGVAEAVIWADSDKVGRLAAIERAHFFRQRIFRIRIVDLYFDDSNRDVADFSKAHADISDDEFTAILEARIQKTSVLP